MSSSPVVDSDTHRTADEDAGTMGDELKKSAASGVVNEGINGGSEGSGRNMCVEAGAGGDSVKCDATVAGLPPGQGDTGATANDKEMRTGHSAVTTATTGAETRTQESKESTVTVKESKDLSLKESKDLSLKESKDSPVKENIDSPVKENKGSPVKESIGSPLKENLDSPSCVKESKDLLGKESDSLMKESKNLPVKKSKVSKESTDSSVVESDKKEKPGPVKSDGHNSAITTPTSNSTPESSKRSRGAPRSEQKSERTPRLQQSNDNTGSSEKKKVPLFEQPVDDSSGSGRGKRERKKVEVLNISEGIHSDRKVVIPEGGGCTIGSIPIAAHNLKIRKYDGECVRILHKVMFGIEGRKHARTINVKKFCGFGFDDTSKEFQKRHHLLVKAKRCNQSLLRDTLALLGLEKSGSRQEMIDRLFYYLITPKDNGVPIPEAGVDDKRKRRSSGRKRSSSGERRGRKSKGDKDRSDEDEEESDAESGEKSDEKESEENSDEEEASDFEEPLVESEESDYETSRKRKKTPKKKPQQAQKKKMVPSKSPAAEAKKGSRTSSRAGGSRKSMKEDTSSGEEEEKPKRSQKGRGRAASGGGKDKKSGRKSGQPGPGAGGKKGKGSGVTISSDTDSDDGEPLSKKSKTSSAAASKPRTEPPKPPTNDELKECIEKLVSAADLDQVTMKGMCQQVYDKYPNFDLTGRKDFIRETIKKVISKT